MFLTKLKRIFKTAIVNFWRNGSINIATTGIMTVTLLSISILVILTFLGNSLIENFKTKIDISVYFFSEASEEDILKVRDEVVALPEVREILYISKEQAWERFKVQYSDNPVISQGIGELDENPLFATLSIKAKNMDQYSKINEFLSNARFKDTIQKVSFDDNKTQIAKLSLITKTAQKDGAIVILVFVIISLFVIFNAVRLTMYNYKQEVKIMNLVGAGKWYIQLPFIIEGALYGIIGSIFSISILAGMIFLTKDAQNIESFLYGGSSAGVFKGSLTEYFKNNFLLIFGVQLAAGIFIGVLSSLIAIRKYMKI
ncbi:ABC transporter permease [Patescibacteria group bacterium]|nr:ABC transporter permease [Patescibacteria group bacterium]MBU4579890.1 ABC transporter permease [Patescibacteria group bacterium]